MLGQLNYVSLVETASFLKNGGKFLEVPLFEMDIPVDEWLRQKLENAFF